MNFEWSANAAFGGIWGLWMAYGLVEPQLTLRQPPQIGCPSFNYFAGKSEQVLGDIWTSYSIITSPHDRTEGHLQIPSTAIIVCCSPRTSGCTMCHEHWNLSENVTWLPFLSSSDYLVHNGNTSSASFLLTNWRRLIKVRERPIGVKYMQCLTCLL